MVEKLCTVPAGVLHVALQPGGVGVAAEVPLEPMPEGSPEDTCPPQAPAMRTATISVLTRMMNTSKARLGQAGTEHGFPAPIVSLKPGLKIL
jgi:hypothetical protein